MKVETLVPIVVAVITGLLGPTVLEFTKTWIIRKRALNKSVSVKRGDIDEIQINLSINASLEKLLTTINCDRIWVAEFHNGGHFYNSKKSIKKFSIFYEITKPGISKIRNVFQNTPTTFFSKTLENLHENSFVVINDFEHSNNLYDIMYEHGGKTIITHVITDSSDDYHGFLVVEYITHNHEITKFDIDAVAKTSTYVSGALSTIGN
jgi:hypothetical protein